MPRDIPVGNGRLLITYDDRFQIRDIYFPHVGQENHAGAGPCRFGVWTDVPGTRQHRLAWSSEPQWAIRQRYLRDTLTTSVSLDHAELQLSLYCNDVTDFNRNIWVRRIKLKNLAGHDRLVKVMHHQDFNMFGAKVGDTAYYDPDLRAMVHYRGQRYLMVSFFGGGEQRIDEYATGTSGFNGAEGTWRDAEDGHLQGNPIAQGAVDSTICHHVHLQAHGQATIYMVLAAGQSREELIELHKWLIKHSPQGVIDRTSSYWRLWLSGANINFGNLPPRVVDLFKRSLLVVRTQIDNGGAILAANDSDYLQFSRDTYSYMWPRDGALVAHALDMAGYPDIARWFYTFCQNAITPEGYFHHKYNPDGSPASSWHPWVMNGQRAMPIQEDETALVVWALWRHYHRYRDTEFVRPLWVDLVMKAADFMCSYRDQRTGLPLPSYDLWEERWGIHAFTVATVYAGLMSAHHFAVCFGDRERAQRYLRAAQEVKAGAEKHLYSPRLGRFVRRLVPRDMPPPATDGQAPTSNHEGAGNDAAIDDCQSNIENPDTNSLFEVDEVVDASLYALFRFELFDADDPRVVSTMQQVEEKLWVKTRVGGVARYENDYYHRVSEDIAVVPGNPWFICTLWLAEYFIARATTLAELKRALPVFEWCAGHALESGVLAEQVHPHTNEPLSVSPLTWSHATVVSVAINYLEKLEQLQLCGSCRQPMFRLRRRSGGSRRHAAEAQQITLDPIGQREIAAPQGTFTAQDPRSGQALRAALTIDVRDCIGCEVCVAHCAKGVLRMVDGKALIDLRHLNQCDRDGACVEVCPTEVVTLTVQKVTAPAPAEPVGASA